MGVVNLTSDETDEILYLTRVNERAELATYLSDLSCTHQCDRASIIAAAVEDESRNTALHYAAANGHIDLLTYILDLHHNHNHPSPPPTSTITAKQQQQPDRNVDASSTHFLPLLSARNRAGNTPIHWASMNGHVEAVRILHAAGADISMLNEAGRDALQEAVGAERIEVTEWLMGVEGKGKGKGKSEGKDEDKGEGDDSDGSDGNDGGGSKGGK